MAETPEDMQPKYLGALSRLVRLAGRAGMGALPSMTVQLGTGLLAGEERGDIAPWVALEITGTLPLHTVAMVAVAGVGARPSGKVMVALA
tara:strand:- start:3616 stop:3885 length:270 start_codon:yes stop_codon:yes gene_type:complete